MISRQPNLPNSKQREKHLFSYSSRTSNANVHAGPVIPSGSGGPLYLFYSAQDNFQFCIGHLVFRLLIFSSADILLSVRFRLKEALHNSFEVLQRQCFCNRLGERDRLSENDSIKPSPRVKVYNFEEPLPGNRLCSTDVHFSRYCTHNQLLHPRYTSLAWGSQSSQRCIKNF